MAPLTILIFLLTTKFAIYFLFFTYVKISPPTITLTSFSVLPFFPSPAIRIPKWVHVWPQELDNEVST